MKKYLHFVSSNDRKYIELCEIFNRDFPEIEIIQIKTDIVEIQGNQEEIIKNKMQCALEKINKNNILVEDVSLSFNAFGDLPGVYIKQFVKDLKPGGLYMMVSPFNDHSAIARCIYGIKKNKNSELKTFIGEINGEIVKPNVNEDSGWWDSCFKPNGYDKIYAEFTPYEKSKISHRAKSAEKLIKWLKDNPDFFDEDSKIRKVASIGDDCMNCGMCKNACACDAIKEGGECWFDGSIKHEPENTDHYYVVKNKCVGCGRCSKTCPINNIEMIDFHN